MEFDASQNRAIALCCSDSRIIAVSGAAGYGKTTIMREVYKLLSEKGYSCVMCAPTGKAARRITQATGIPAKTIHRMLEFPAPYDIDEKTGKPATPGMPTRNRIRPLDENCVLIDEAPMVSSHLMRQIYEALPTGGIVRMFGDMNQLPPIADKERVAPFWEVLHKKRTCFDGTQITHGAILTTNHRQNDGSGIITNSRVIIEGRYPKKYDDFRLYTTTNHTTTLKKLLIDNNADFSSLENQIICPVHKGKVGTITLNEIVRMFYNPKPEKKLRLGRHSWFPDDAPYYIGIGDKVVMSKNWYDLGMSGILNGEVGRVLDITAYDELVVDFDPEIVTIPPTMSTTVRGADATVNPQKDIDLAYVMTTHRAQGSEYKNIIYIIDRYHSKVLNRNNFYTAVTRAKHCVNVIYHPRAMSLALSKAV